MVGHLHEHKKAVNQLLVSPDAKVRVTCRSCFRACHAFGQLVSASCLPSAVFLFSKIQFFASCSDDGSVRIWDCNKLEGKAVTNQSRQQYSKQVCVLRSVGSIRFCY